jgi:hypothetical protein
MVDFVSLFTGMSERDIGFLLKNLVQDSINSELTNAEISEIDNKTQVLITNSKDVELMNDISIQSAINIEPSTVYLMPEEPDGINLKLWLKFQNAGELRDWSYQKNKSYSTGANTMPGLFSKYNDHSMMKYELYSYFNGLSHYAYTMDSPTVRILPNITASKITSFFMRLVPVSLAKVLYAENNALFTKVDDDQLRYGYSVTIDLVGNMHFYVRNDYRQYHLFIKDAYNYILTDPLYDNDSNFRFENFSKKNFLTGFQYLCGLVDAELPFHDWFFKYNPTTHNMSVINTIENNVAAVMADTSLVTPTPYLSIPMQEGRYTHLGNIQTTVYDNSTHANNGTISGYATGGTWNNDNTLTSLGSNVAGTSDGMSIDFSSISSLNSLTEFTISFWYNPLTELINNKSYNTRLFSKGYAVANSIYIERTTGVNDLKFAFRSSDNVEKSVTFSNPFTTSNKWYLVTAKWKSGEKLKLSINNANEVQSASTVTTTLATTGNNIKLYNATRAPIGIMALLKVHTTQITQLQQDDLFYEGYHNPLFPKSENIQPVVEEDPPDVFVPFTNAYTLDKMATPVLADYRKINSLAGDNPFIQRYSVADGTSSTDPELNPYTINDGSTTASDPETRVGAAPATIDSTANSNGTIGDGQNNAYTLQIDAAAGTGIGDTMIGKVLTKAIVWMRKTSSSITGTLYFRIWNATTTDLTSVATLGSVAADTLTQGSSGSEWYPITFQNTANTVALADGFRLGVEYQGYGSGDVVNVQRQSPRAEVTTIQSNYDTSWHTNSSFTMKCDLYTGAGTVATEPNIIMKSGSYSRVAEAFGTADTLLTKIIGKVTMRLKKVGSPTGTASIVLMNNASTVKATLGTINVTTLTTSTADYTFSNYTHGQVVASTDRIAITWTPSASGEVHVMTNNGNTTSNTWNGTASSVFKWISSWVADSAIDMAGKIFTGGTTFDAWLRFSTTTTRITVKAVNSSSSIHNRKLTKVVVRAKKFGSPAGIISCYVRDSTDAVKVTYSSVDVSTLTTSYADMEFVNVVHTYLLNSGTGSADKISVEYSGADASNYVELIVNKDVLDTSNTIAQIYDSGNYVDKGQLDISGKMYDGGEPDLNSRTRVVQSVEHQNSILKGKKITRVKAFLIRTTTSTSGTAYCNIRRGTDGSLVKTIGTVGVSGLNTTVGTPSQITFTDTTNNYPINVGDKIGIEFNGGNATDQLGVLVRSVTPNYDLSNSYIRKFDEVDYDDVETTMDLCAVMDEGGFSFTPDAGSIPDPTPTNIKDLLFCAGNNALSGFFEAFLMEFRIYAKDITLTNADNLYNNRYSISNIGHNEILCPFSLKCNTLDPV